MILRRFCFFVFICKVGGGDTLGTLKGGTHLMILLVSPILVINIFHGVVYFGRFRPLTTPTWIQTNFKKTSACPRQDGLHYACQEAFENPACATGCQEFCPQLAYSGSSCTESKGRRSAWVSRACVPACRTCTYTNVVLRAGVSSQE